MFNKENMGNGYSLIQHKADLWEINFKNGDCYIATFKEVAVYLVVSLQFDILEINIAVEDMLKNDTNVAQFGFRKTFLYSEVGDKKKKMAS